MQKPPLPLDEAGRIEALRAYDVLDTPPEEAFDDLTRLASQICGTPMAMISLIDRDRQWYKAKVGTEVTETPRDVAFCAHAMLAPDLFIVPDARADERFVDNPLVTTGPQVRFYAGAPLITPEGQALGSLCAVDRVPHQPCDGRRCSCAPRKSPHAPRPSTSRHPAPHCERSRRPRAGGEPASSRRPGRRRRHYQITVAG